MKTIIWLKTIKWTKKNTIGIFAMCWKSPDSKDINMVTIILNSLNSFRMSLHCSNDQAMEFRFMPNTYEKNAVASNAKYESH